MIRMFRAGVSEMCSLAVACGVTEFQKASRNCVDTLAASMSPVRYAAQSGVSIDFCASRYATGPELESVSEVRARAAARVRAFIAAARERGNSPSVAPAIAKNVGDRSGEGKVLLNEYEKAVAYLKAQEAMPKAAAQVSAHSLAQTPDVGADCDHMWMQEYLQKCQEGLTADVSSD
jgi:hypothetical protein